MSKSLTINQLKALAKARHYGKLIITRSGSWTYPGCPLVPDTRDRTYSWYAIASTINHLVRKGLLTRADDGKVV